MAIGGENSISGVRSRRSWLCRRTDTRCVHSSQVGATQNQNIVKHVAFSCELDLQHVLVPSSQVLHDRSASIQEILFEGGHAQEPEWVVKEVIGLLRAQEMA